MDVPNEVELQRKKIALAMLEQEAHLHNTGTAKEIIENKNLRENYKEKLQTELNISKRKTEQLYRYVKRCIIGK